MVSEKLVQIINRLIKSTASGKLSWEESTESGVYVVSFPNYAVSISVISGARGEDVVIKIYNADGEVIERVTDEDFPDGLLNGEISYNVLSELYSSARRNAVGIEKALDSILAELPDDD